MPSSSKIESVLVTGSSGTIGTALCEKLSNDGYTVIGVDKRPNPWSKRVQDLTKLGDLTQSATLEHLRLARPDVIVHLAANARVYFSVTNPSLAIENMSQTLNVLEYARKHKVPRLLFASSREVYGKQEEGSLVSETQAQLDGAESPYTASKVGAEAFVAAYRSCFQIGAVVVRFSNVYGRYDDSERIVPTFIRQLRDQQPLTVFGKNKTYDFTFIDDAVQGVAAAIARFDEVSGETFNLASGQGSTLEEMAKMLQKIMGVETPITVGEKRTGELTYYVADISKAKEKLGYEPKVMLEEGLRRAVDWLQEYANAPAKTGKRDSSPDTRALYGFRK
jgi:nucleoside-diphosphate-sugar epimerase